MSADVVERAVAALEEAYSSGMPIDPLTASFPGLDLDTAYAIQLAQIERRLARGAHIRGHKVGLTSLAMQQQLGVDQPDYGHLLDDMFVEHDATVAAGTFLQPRVEPEIAFVLRSGLAGPGITIDDAERAVDYVVPALELIDSRIRDWKITLLDTIADNASSAAVVLGAERSSLHDHDLPLVDCVFHRNGEVVDTGVGGAVLGNPINALVWLANTLGERGVELEAGHVVLPGACTASIPAQPGDTISATFAGLGSVSVAFAA